MSIHPALIFVAMATTAACGASSVARTPVVTGPSHNNVAAFSAADFSLAVAEDERAAFLAETSASLIPFGTATYDGTIRSGAVINNDDGFDVIGDLSLEVDINSRSTFAGRNPISGTITDLTVIDRQSANLLTPLDGTLDITGDSTSGELEATATGLLTRERIGTVDDTARWSIDLDGSFRDDFERADTVAGIVNGGTTGSTSNDYDVTLIGDGRFVGVERD
jgi:hypothetical protein